MKTKSITEKLDIQFNNMDKYEKALIPIPTDKFEIGEKVCIGSLNNPEIFKSYLDGKFYAIKYLSFNKKDNKFKEEYDIFSWLNISKLKDLNTYNLFKENDIKIDFLTSSIRGLLLKAYTLGIDTNPSYQRDIVWNQEDKENLIDSIVNNIDIGKFVLVINNDFRNNKQYEILDGKQRLTALCEFYENRLSYKGIFYKNFSLYDKHQFMNYLIPVAELNNITEKQKLEYFVKLNTTGHVMDKENINKVKKILNNF